MSSRVLGQDHVMGHLQIQVIKTTPLLFLLLIINLSLFHWTAGTPFFTRPSMMGQLLNSDDTPLMVSGQGTSLI